MSNLIHKDSEQYGGSFQDHLLEQYKIVRGRIVDIINDRNTQNKFLFTVLTAILAIPVASLARGTDSGLFPLFLMVFPLAGAVVSWYWILWNRTFGEGLAAAYRLLKEMEVHLPAQPFTLENQYRKEAAESKREDGRGEHRTTTDFTILMARLFFVGNIVVVVFILSTILFSS